MLRFSNHPSWRAIAWLLLAMFFGSVIACSSSTPLVGVSMQGEVDTNLPPVSQAKQQIIRRLFIAANDGATDAATLKLYEPTINFKESEAEFLEGHAWLARWEFNGPVKGDEVPVILYFSDVAFHVGDPSEHVPSERVYLVKQSGARATVTRKK